MNAKPQFNKGAKVRFTPATDYAGGIGTVTGHRVGTFRSMLEIVYHVRQDSPRVGNYPVLDVPASINALELA